MVGRIIALSLFVSNKLLKGLGNQEDKEWEATFLNLKHYLINLPVLVKPQVRDNLMIYLAILATIVSLILVRKEEGNVQKPDH